VNTARFVARINLSKLRALIVLSFVDFLVYRTHQVTNFESNAADFNQVIFSDFITRKIKLRLPNMLHYLPNFLLWLFFKNNLSSFVDKVLVVNPIRVVTVQASSYYSFFIFIA